MALALGKMLEGKGKLLSEEGDCSLLSSVSIFSCWSLFLGFIVIKMQFEILVNLGSQMSPYSRT